MTTIFHIRSVFAIAVIALACSSQDAPKDKTIDFRDSVVIGMTYDDVERLLGKPLGIQRGVNQLRSIERELYGNPSELQMNYWEIQLQELELRLKVMKNREQPFEQFVDTHEPVLYVTWWYNSTKLDTIRYIEPSWTIKTIADTPIKQFIVNGKTVSEDEYDLVGDTAYWGAARMFLYSKQEWDQDKNNGLTVSPPEFAKKEVKITPRTKKQPYLVPDTTYQIVTSKFAIVFDAASGRVLSKDFYPFFVEDLR